MNSALLLAAAGTNPTGGTSSVTLMVAVLTALGIGSIVSAIITGFYSKRKLGADAAQAITNAAANVTTLIERRLVESQAEVDKSKELMKHMVEAHHAELTKMAEAHAFERTEMRRVLQLHVAWDAIAIARMAEFGVELPPAPPVTPAQRFTDDHGFPLSLQ
jgi:hypothetical protein